MAQTRLDQLQCAARAAGCAFGGLDADFDLSHPTPPQRPSFAAGDWALRALNSAMGRTEA